MQRDVPAPRSVRSFLLFLVAAAALLAASTAAAEPNPSPAFAGYTLDQPPPSVTFAPPIAIEAPPAAPAPAPDAAPPPGPRARSVAFDLSVGTQVPILIGGQVTLDVHRFLLQGEIGVLPTAYVNVVNGVLVSSGAYDQATAALVKSALGNSLVVRLSAGVRPFADHGLEIVGGYTLASVHGGVSARQTIETVTGTTLPAELGDAEVPISSTIHSVHLQLGWRWVLADHLVIRASVGYLQSVASSSHVGMPEGVPVNAITTAALARVNGAVDELLDKTYKTYVKTPVVGLSLGYRF
jgi:hypothetical protein